MVNKRKEEEGGGAFTEGKAFSPPPPVEEEKKNKYRIYSISLGLTPSGFSMVISSCVAMETVSISFQFPRSTYREENPPPMIK